MSERPEWRDIVLGIGLSFFMNIAFVLICIILISIGSAISAIGNFTAFLSFLIIGIGLSQLLYVIPTVINLKRKQKWGVMKGVIIGASITALLSGGCFLWVIFVFHF